MIQSLWVEVVFAPPITWADGRPLELHVPFEVAHPIRFGPKGSGAELNWPENYELRLSPGPGGVIFTDSRPQQTLTPLLPPGDLWMRSPLILRVLRSPQESAGWPRSLARPGAPWGDEMLSVLGDQLLEQGRQVGHRFLDRDPEADLLWLPALTADRVSRDAVITWRRGVVDTLAVRAPAGWEFGRSLSSQALCAPMRQLRIKCDLRVRHAEVMAGLLAGGGLPCLEWLRFENGNDGRQSAATLRTLPGFAEAFPALTSFEVEGNWPLTVVG